MTTYKYLSDTVVAKIDDDGKSRMSCTIENPEYLDWLAEGNTTEPADPVPNPRIAEILSALIALDAKKIRPLATGDTTFLADLNVQSDMLRAELQGLASD